jgi:hypothetical protein
MERSWLMVLLVKKSAPPFQDCDIPSCQVILRKSNWFYLMKPSERVRLLRSIIANLGQDDWSIIDMVLGQYEGKRSDNWNGSKESYIAWSIEKISDEALQDLADCVGVTPYLDSPKLLNEVSDSQIEHIWGDRRYFRLFLSHITECKTEAAALKDALSKFGIMVFVAHADIRPTREWLNEISLALHTMDALAALLVPNFHKSAWTDQEIGFALGRGVPILPLKFGQDPYGFIDRFQALNCSADALGNAAYSIAEVLAANLECELKISDSIARSLCFAGNFRQAKLLTELLEIPEKLPLEAIGCIRQAVCENDQVSRSWGVPERLNSLLQKNGFPPVQIGTGSSYEASDDEIPF